ncbi:MAG TPA: hypothetical protein VE359_05190 [Vicinamibacteria bacterium]|jgi:hypothetical protein|nr:hypothetical protein [Vicinamibacteria bacterium]
MASPLCPHCHEGFALEPFLRGVTGYSATTDSGGAPCPLCRESLEFRVASGALEIGFTYWGGSLHFDALSVHRVRGLRLVHSGASITAVLNGVEFPFPNPGGTTEA